MYSFFLKNSILKSIYSTVYQIWWKIIFHLNLVKFMVQELVPSTRCTLRPQKRTDETVVITGASSGIGKYLVKKFLEADMNCVLGCRNIEDGIKAIKEIRKGGVTNGKVEVLPLDLRCFNSVREFAYKTIARTSQINILVNNAGILKGDENFDLTAEGLEERYQVNYLSHVLLTMILLPKLVESGAAEKTSRIVNVSCTSHNAVTPCISEPKMGISKERSYMESKFLLIAFNNYLSSKLKSQQSPVTCYSVYPGITDTNLWANYAFMQKIPAFLKYFVMKSPEQSGRVVLYTALSPSLKNKSGSFLNRGEISPAHPQTYNARFQQSAWKIACKQLQIEDCFNIEVPSDKPLHCNNNNSKSFYETGTPTENCSMIVHLAKDLIQYPRVAALLVENFVSYKLLSNLYTNLFAKRIARFTEAYRSSVLYKFTKLNS